MPQIPKLWSGVLSEPGRRKKYATLVGEIDKNIGSFLSFSPESPVDSTAADGSLSGLPIGVKDNIAVKGRPLTCGSRILENLVAPYTATAVSRLEAAGVSVVGKTNMDEFGMGSSNENSALGTTVNPWNKDHVPGGSSGGSAAAVAAGLVPLALGSDTGGSVRQPANFCGVYGLKPTYGAVSRFGLTAYASSLEVIGTITRDIDLLETAFKVMSARDDRDQSSASPEPPQNSGKTAIMLDIEDGVLDDAVALAYQQTGDALKDSGYTVEKVSLPFLDLVVPAYYTIATAEASANLARYNGIRYGHAPDFAESPTELMKAARHEGFGNEVKLRILLGTYVLRSGFQDQYYGKAQKIRTLIRNELSGVFDSGDLLLMPVFPTQAFLRGDKGMDDYKQRIADVFTCLANLAGLPALSVPVGVDGGLPTGVQFMAPAFAEDRLFRAARDLAGHFPLQTAPGSLDIGSLS
jgi:aspartyl-tRNA(Asn)/glutamyl-tRNA(Gln) amidotransferase subunit A